MISARWLTGAGREKRANREAYRPAVATIG